MYIVVFVLPMWRINLLLAFFLELLGVGHGSAAFAVTEADILQAGHPSCHLTTQHQRECDSNDINQG